MVHILLSNRPGLRNLDHDTQDAVVKKASALAESVRSKVHVLDLAKVTYTPGALTAHPAGKGRDEVSSIVH